MGFLEDIPDLEGFHWADYLVFSISLAITIAIGIFFACTGGKQSTTREFLLADRRAPVIPMAMSLLATYLSAAYVIGVPAEIYYSGVIYTIYLPIPLLLLAVITSLVFIPVFHQLPITSAYEYFELRYNFAIRIFATCIYYIAMVLFLAIVTYGPALALNVVIGIPLWLCVLGTNLVTTFYTTIGGLKAVIWTDVVQISIVLLGFITLASMAIVDIGGVGEVYRRALDGGRLYWNEFSPDPRVRHTFWGLTIGHIFLILAVYCSNQSSIQRYMSVPTVRRAQGTILMTSLFSSISLLFISWIGLSMYAYYVGCDPMLSRKITRPDHMVPFFMMSIFGKFPGLPGLFIAALFSAAMSSVTSIINSLALVTLEDFFKPAYRAIKHREMSEKTATRFAKLVALFLGLATIGLAYLTPFLGSRISQIVQTTLGLTGGVLLGLFFCGILMPWTNSLGASVGAVTSLAFTAWIIAGGIMYNRISRLPLSKANCTQATTTTISLLTNLTTSWMMETTTTTALLDGNVTTTMAQIATTMEEPLFMDLYRISYKWYGLISCLTVVLVTNLVSCLSGRRKGLPPLDPRLVFSWKRAIGRTQDLNKDDSKDAVAQVDLPVECSQ